MGNEYQQFKENFFDFPTIGLQLDISKAGIGGMPSLGLETQLERAFQGIADIERGEIMNPDEGRMVGHYWLRAPELAPASAQEEGIASVPEHITQFVQAVQGGSILSQDGRRYTDVLVVGIGGSALGSQFISTALCTEKDAMRLSFIDNTDPDGIDIILNRLGEAIRQTLVIIISKSGGTIETRNGMEEVRACFKKWGLDFAHSAIAVTQKGSQLDQMAAKEGWLKTFPLWDFIGGRTSVLSAVGLLPLALQGISIRQLLAGAAACDQLTRVTQIEKNPAALLAAAWHRLCGGMGGTQMVILPYKDRLCFFAKYLQQLIMESLGKAKDMNGEVVNQGIAVFGNKGTTDQHSYMQQLLEGPKNSFVTFIEVLKDRNGCSMEVGENSTSGDFLSAFLLGTRQALEKAGRPSITLTIWEVSPFSVGMLIALYERAVSIYALLVNINAYHQPAVESGKKAAAQVIELKNKALDFLQQAERAYTVEALAKELGTQEMEILFKLLQHLSANPQNGIEKTANSHIFETEYRFSAQLMQKEKTGR